jgi:cobalamin-dependent methionine synthase I
MIAASPALLARERQILARYAGSLAELLADETGAARDDLRPRVVANALIAAHGALIDFVRRRIVQDPLDIPALARDVRAQGEQAFELLGQGLAGYAVKRPERPGQRA